jgi:hypothetical protein
MDVSNAKTRMGEGRGGGRTLESALCVVHESIVTVCIERMN